jgi:hypothetical protein
LLQTTRAVATDRPIQPASARQSETQARARYDAGLAAVPEVAEAQSRLAQARVPRKGTSLPFATFFGKPRELPLCG